jgi:hypothetical protein
MSLLTTMLTVQLQSTQSVGGLPSLAHIAAEPVWLKYPAHPCNASVVFRRYLPFK